MNSITERMKAMVQANPEISMNSILAALWPGVERSEREVWMTAVWYCRARLAALRGVPVAQADMGVRYA